MENVITGMFSFNGSLYRFTSHHNEKTLTQDKLSSYQLAGDKHSFVDGDIIDSSIIAQRGASLSVQCAKACIDLETGSVNPFVVFKNINQCDSYVVYALNTDRVSEIGTFSIITLGGQRAESTDVGAGVSESQICTQVFSTFRPTQTQHRGPCDVADEVQSLFLLDGPCLCCLTQERLYYCVKLQTAFMGTIPFSVAHLPRIIKDFQVLCLKCQDDKLVVLGTAITRPNTIKSKECQSRQFVSVFVNINSADPADCPTQGCNSGAVEFMQEQTFVPDIYSDIVVCANVFSCHFEFKEQQPDLTFTNTQIFNGNPKTPKSTIKCDNTTYICTSLKQLVAFKNGAVKDCVDIGVECGRAIRRFETFTGQEFLVVEATNGKVTVINEATFQVTHTFDNVATTFVDDFASNGAEQLLVVLKETGQETELENGLKTYVLTDCEGIHIDNQKPSMNSQDSPQNIYESLQSTVTALQARLQAAYSSLHEATRLRDLKDQVIAELCLSIQSTGLDGQGKTNHIKSSDRLVALIPGQCEQNLEAKPAKVGTSADHVDMDTEDAVLGTQTLGKSPTVSDGPIVSQPWQKLLTPDIWVVGVHVTNTSDRDFHGIHLMALSCRNTLNNTSLTSRCNVLEVLCTRHPGDTNDGPKVKRVREADLMSSRPTWVLAPGSSTYCVIVMDIPKFFQEEIVRSLTLSWSEPDKDDCLAESTEADTKKRSSKSCGEVAITVKELLDGCHALWLKASDFENEDFSGNCQALLCLDSVQQLLKIDVTATFSALPQHLPHALESLGLVYIPALGSYMCLDPQGRLGWCRVKLPKHMAHLNTQMTISSKGCSQLLEMVHALYSKLPKDIIMLPGQENPPTKELKELLHTLSAELSHAEANLTQIFVDKVEDTQEKSFKVMPALKKLFEAKKSQLENQQPAKVDPGKYQEFVDQKTRLRETSDKAFKNFAYKCALNEN